MSTGFFGDIQKIQYEGPDSTNPLAFRHYNPDEIVMGKRMEDHLRFAVAYWHTLVWPGGDPFGGQTFERPWFDDSMKAAKLKADVAFEFFSLLGAPFYCFHDADVRPEGKDFVENTRNLNEIVDYFAEKQAATGVKLLWGTANLFSHRRYMGGAATNPDPEVFAFAAATVKTCIDATHRLDGANYVLWGGREGYETLLNTDMKQELDQLGRFVNMVVEYKHKIGFKGTILIEPKPQEPTKHQYDYDVATVYGFLKKYGLENEVKLNVEQGHAILAGHSFEHELALANAHGILGSIDMNRNDYQSGWDTDQFPNNVPEMALAYYQVLAGGGFTTGGTNFDSKLRRQSIEPDDLLIGHIGGMDCCARGLKAAAKMIEDKALSQPLADRYAGWQVPRGRRSCRAVIRWRKSKSACWPTASTRVRVRAARSCWKTSSTVTSDDRIGSAGGVSIAGGAPSPGGALRGVPADGTGGNASHTRHGGGRHEDDQGAGPVPGTVRRRCRTVPFLGFHYQVGGRHRLQGRAGSLLGRAPVRPEKGGRIQDLLRRVCRPGARQWCGDYRAFHPSAGPAGGGASGL